MNPRGNSAKIQHKSLESYETISHADSTNYKFNLDDFYPLNVSPPKYFAKFRTPGRPN